MAFSAHAGESRRIETEKQNGDRAGKSGEADEQEEEQTEPETDDPQEVDGGETEVPQKQEAEETVWEIVLSDIHPEVPEEGRVYDGTDQIRIAFSWDIRRRCSETDTDFEEPSDNAEGKLVPPKVSVTCNARLESPDAGLRNVLYDFRISSDRKSTRLNSSHP